MAAASFPAMEFARQVHLLAGDRVLRRGLPTGGLSDPFHQAVARCAESLGRTTHRLLVASEAEGVEGTLFEIGRQDPSAQGGWQVRQPTGEGWGAGQQLLVTVRSGGHPCACTRVDAFLDGQSEGFRVASPATTVVWADGNMACSYVHLGHDLTDLVTDPVTSVMAHRSDVRRWASLELLPDPRHVEVLAMVARAEERQEAVALLSGEVPGVALLRGHGMASYCLVAEADVLLHAERLAATGHAFVKVRQEVRPDGLEVRLTRKVGSVLHGPEPGDPGVCLSRLGNDRMVPTVTFGCFDAGERLPTGLGRVMAQVTGMFRG